MTSYYERNKEKIKAYSRKYKKEHPEKVLTFRKKRNPNYKPRTKLPEEELKKRQRERNRKYMRKRRLQLRVRVFSRDNFTCKYCGRKPPEVVLEIDHIHPKSKGGKDDIENYQTLCSDCNLGKKDSILNEF